MKANFEISFYYHYFSKDSLHDKKLNECVFLTTLIML